jgi:hypothetical protein
MANLSLIWLTIIIIVSLIYVGITQYPHITWTFWAVSIGFIVIAWLFYSKNKLVGNIRASWLVTIAAILATVGLVGWAIKGRMTTFNAIVSSSGLTILYWIAVVAMVIFALFNLVNNFWLGVFALVIAFILLVLPGSMFKGDMVSEGDKLLDVRAFVDTIIARLKPTPAPTPLNV